MNSNSESNNKLILSDKLSDKKLSIIDHITSYVIASFVSVALNKVH